MSPFPVELDRVAHKALAYVPAGGTLGLGTGHAATAFLHALAADGRSIRGVPTSRVSASLAEQLGIPLTSLDEVPTLDVDFDGADEVDPAGNLIKGYGGALVREKIVAAASKQFIVLVGPEKIVPKLGHRGKLPIEVLPFALGPCRRVLPSLGCDPVLRMDGDRPFVTDNGNFILDCRIEPLSQPEKLETTLLAIPGIVGTGLFLNMATIILVGHTDSVEVLTFHATSRTPAAPSSRGA